MMLRAPQRHHHGRVWMILAAGVLLLSLPGVPAVADPAGDPPRHHRRRPPNAERVQQRLDELIAQGASEDDPRVQKLKGVLRLAEAVGEGPPRRHGKGGRHHTDNPETLLQFVEQHPELHKLLAFQPDGTPVPQEHLLRRLRRFGRQLSRIKRAFEDGETERGELMIQGTKTQYAIMQQLRRYHDLSEEDPQRAELRDSLAVLVQQRVSIELEVEALKLRSLRERLDQQEQRLNDDRLRQSEIAAKKLDKLLSGRHHRGRPGGRHRGWNPERSFDDPPASGDAPPVP